MTPLVAAYFDKAVKELKAARLMMANEYLSKSISCSYYVMFYLATALLLDVNPDRNFSKHSSVLGAFGKEFGAKQGQWGLLNRYINDAMEGRHEADYDPLWTGETEEHAQLRLSHAQEFLAFTEQYFKQINTL